MKGQLALESLIAFAATAALAAALLGGILAQRASVWERASEFAGIAAAESAARAAEAAYHGGLAPEGQGLGSEHSIEGGKFHLPADGKMVEAGGVYVTDPDEPV